MNLRNLEHSLEVLFDSVIPDLEEIEQQAAESEMI
jgi:hypothetical protein